MLRHSHGENCTCMLLGIRPIRSCKWIVLVLVCAGVCLCEHNWRMPHFCTRVDSRRNWVPVCLSQAQLDSELVSSSNGIASSGGARELEEENSRIRADIAARDMVSTCLDASLLRVKWPISYIYIYAHTYTHTHTWCSPSPKFPTSYRIRRTRASTTPYLYLQRLH
jgi:hypothetical protein